MCILLTGQVRSAFITHIRNQIQACQPITSPSPLPFAGPAAFQRRHWRTRLRRHQRRRARLFPGPVSPRTAGHGGLRQPLAGEGMLGSLESRGAARVQARQPRLTHALISRPGPRRYRSPAWRSVFPPISRRANPFLPTHSKDPANRMSMDEAIGHPFLKQGAAAGVAGLEPVDAAPAEHAWSLLSSSFSSSSSSSSSSAAGAGRPRAGTGLGTDDLHGRRSPAPRASGPSIDVVKSLGQFMRMSRFKKLMLEAVAFSLTPAQIAVLREEFQLFDQVKLLAPKKPLNRPYLAP